MRPLPDCERSRGSQPTSSSDPEQMTRSASRMRAMRLGRASMRCGSWRAVVAETTETLSPPSSCASADHSGSQAKMFSAKTGLAMNRRTAGRRFFMLTSELVRAVRELQPHAAELAWIPVDHHRMAFRVVGTEDRKIRGVQRARDAGGPGVQLVVAVARAPLRQELANALQVPARLARR